MARASILRLVVVSCCLFVLSGTAFAQELTDEEAEACAGCAGCGGVMLFMIVVVITLNIALLVWVARDARARNMDSAALWMMLVMFASFIGLIIYICSRPQGHLVQCPHCRNKRLQGSAKCPHCGNA